jgi:hypothetical protein
VITRKPSLSAATLRRWHFALAFAGLFLFNLSPDPTITDLLGDQSFISLQTAHAQGGGADRTNGGADGIGSGGGQGDTGVELLDPAQETAAIVSGWAEFATLRESGGAAGADGTDPAAAARGSNSLSPNEEAAAIVRGWSNTK